MNLVGIFLSKLVGEAISSHWQPQDPVVWQQNQQKMKAPNIDTTLEGRGDFDQRRAMKNEQ